MSETGERKDRVGGVSAQQGSGELAKRESRHPAVQPDAGAPPPPPPDDAGWQRFGQWWGKPMTVLAVLTLLLLSAGFALALLVTRQNQPVDPNPTATVTRTVAAPGPTVTITVVPGPSVSGPPDDNPEPTTGPGGRASLPPVPSDVSFFQTGQFNANTDVDFDLDLNEQGRLASDSLSDLVVTDDGVFTTNSAILARFSGTGQPQPSDCANLPFPNWGTSLLTKDITAEASYCVITNNDRYGFFTTHSKVTGNQAGTDLDRVAFSFGVWTGPDD